MLHCRPLSLTKYCSPGLGWMQPFQRGYASGLPVYFLQVYDDSDGAVATVHKFYGFVASLVDFDAGSQRALDVSI